MKFNILFSFSIFFIVGSSLFAQETQTKIYFFDSNWQKATTDNYTYYRLVEVYPNGNYKNPIVDYYRNGAVQSIIKADSYNLSSGASFTDAGGRNGEIFFYDISGELESYYKYVDREIVTYHNSKEEEDEWTLEDGLKIAQIGYTAIQILRLLK
jgi:hypothetical protein